MLNTHTEALFPQMDLTYMSVTVFHYRTQQRIFRKDTTNFI